MSHSVEHWTIDSSSVDETIRLGRCLGEVATGGLVVGLVGTLGAGKTHFTRGVAFGLGVAASVPVVSPTFMLIQEYHGRLPLFHFDSYRLKDPAQFAELGTEEYFGGEGVCLVEWSNRVDELLPQDRMTITLEATGETTRRMTIQACGRTSTTASILWHERAKMTSLAPVIASKLKLLDANPATR